jgi:hypothetical protein
VAENLDFEDSIEDHQLEHPEHGKTHEVRTFDDDRVE